MKPAAARPAAPGNSGTWSAHTSAAVPLARSMRCRWPSRPKPVTSVAATAPARSAASLAAAFRVVMASTAADSTSGGAAPRLCAVATTPVPIGLVSTSRSPSRARSTVIRCRGSAIPTTARPYLGSGSSMVWPPTTRQPAAAAASAPPRSTSASSSTGSVWPGQAVRLSAMTGRPPIAYTSDSALVAATRPQSRASSTIGVKKSVVSTRARSESKRSTAASSPSAAPTSRSPAAGTRPPGWPGPVPSVAINSSRADNGSLHAQPAPWDSEVRRTCSPTYSPIRASCVCWSC